MKLVVLVLVSLVTVARADAPTPKRAIAAAKAWLGDLGADGDAADALDRTAEPFLFDHDAKPCKGKKKTAELIACLASEGHDEIAWAPAKVRVHDDATFLSWQPNTKRDVIEAHRKQLAKLKDHAFVHFDATAHDGTFEIVIAVKLDDDGKPRVDAFLANWLPAPTLPDEAAARATASKWTADLASDDKAAAQRTAFPFWSLGLPHGKACKDEQRATDARGFAAIASCVAQADASDVLARLPHGKWELVTDVDQIPSNAEDKGNFAIARDTLDRLSFDHVLLFDRWRDDDTTFEIVVAVRADKDRQVIDAVVATLY